MNPALNAHSIKIATFNLLHSDLRFDQRMQWMADQAASLSLQVLLLQEVRLPLDGGTPDWLTALSKRLNLAVAAMHPSSVHHSGKYRSATAILTNFPVLDYGVTPCPEDLDPASVWAHLLTTSGRSLLVYTMHGSWGGHLPYDRSRQIAAMEEHARSMVDEFQETEPIVILGGDLNATPEEDCIRFLKGLSSFNGQGAYWVDVWQTVGKGPGHTSVPTLPGFDTARSVGISLPEMIPARRIDYLFVRGWAYGRPGTPVEARLCFTEPDSQGYTASDHYGIVANIWCPPLVLSPTSVTDIQPDLQTQNHR